MNKNHAFFFVVVFLCFSSLNLQAQVQSSDSDDTSIDQIVAQVNDHIILKSEVDQRVQQYMYQLQQQSQQKVAFSKELWYTILQDMVEDDVLLDRAAVDSVTVSDDKVDQAINQNIQRSINQIGSETALEKQVGKSIIQLKAELRDQYKKSMTVQEYKRKKRDKIEITRPEVEDFFKKIPQDSLPTIPEQVAVSQIVIIPPPTKNAEEKAYKFAQQLRDSVVNYGKSIEEMAKKYSDGPSASNNGRIPLIAMSDLVSEYSAAAAALKPGGISQVVKTQYGYHIIRLNKRVGDKIDTNQILIKVDKDSFNDQAAIDSLKAIKDSVLADNDITFADMARKKSEDPNTAPLGGRLLNPRTGSRMLSIDQIDPALYRVVLLLNKEGDISEPKPFNIGNENNTKRAFRIVRLDEHNTEHKANLKDDYKFIEGYALQEKQYRLMQDWIRKLSKDVYIEYKIPVPKQITQLQK